MDKAHYLRSITSFINKIQEQLYDIQYLLPRWSYRQAEYLAPGQYSYLTDWLPITTGEIWNGQTVWFKNSFVLDDCFAEKNVELLFENMGESLVYLNGLPVQGLDDNRNTVKISGNSIPGTHYEVLVESCPQWQRMAHARHSGLEYGPHIFKRAMLVTTNPTIQRFLDDFQCLHEVYLNTPCGKWEELVNFARMQIKPYSCREELISQIEAVAEILHRELYHHEPLSKAQTIYAVGNSHLDLTYLWPAKETVRKTARTFSNMLQLLATNPSFRFSQSQPALYQFCKDHYPQIYQEVQANIREGRWELLGGMYVEPDCNLPSGESLIRQFLYGQRFYQDEFGKMTEICWLPDTFGFSGILPQILRKCGINYFYTAKLRRNSVNEFPFNVFFWEGIDNSKILSVVDAFGSYDGKMALEEITAGLKKYNQRHICPDMMYVYGYGDGGGGVTRQMIQQAVRYSHFSDLPEVKLTTVQEFFQNLSEHRTALPVWHGELYFEWHQGTYTSQAQLKALNRKTEILYRNLEILAVLSNNFDPDQNARIRYGWEKILFNQFHDILPGSCQGEGVQEALQRYETAREIAEDLIQGYMKFFYQDMVATGPTGDIIAFFNTLPFSRTDYLELEWELDDGHRLNVTDLERQTVTTAEPAGPGKFRFLAADLPPFGYKLFRITAEPAQNIPFKSAILLRETTAEFILETTILRMNVSKETGQITSIYDKEFGREVLSGAGNYLELFPEMYDFYDAWNIHEASLNQGERLTQVISVQIHRHTSQSAGVKVTRTIHSSRIIQELTLSTDSRRIEFLTQVDWRENGRLLKVGFDLNLLSSKATYDLGFGNIERSTLKNTTWDQAQYEVVGHKWADLSEANYGVALINDSKYGYDIKNGRMRLTLLKSPKYPDESCDLGEHRIRYALFIHAGGWREGRVDREGYQFNTPPLSTRLSAMAASVLEPVYSFLDCESQGVFLETLKYSEDQSGDIILRAYENHGGYEHVRIDLTSLALTSVFECDMLEQNLEKVPLESGNITLTFRPYEIKTLRLIGAPRQKHSSN